MNEYPEPHLHPAIENAKPCPSPECTGGHPDLDIIAPARWWSVKCSRCGTQGPSENSRKAAVARWNSLPRAEQGNQHGECLEPEQASHIVTHHVNEVGEVEHRIERVES